MIFIASMYWMVLAATAILGLIVGSFLNVVILRLNTGMGIGGRSHCFSCNKQLAWYELIPLFSYLFQKGRCRNCKSKISIQYPLVEAITAIAFVIPVIMFPVVGMGSLFAIGMVWILAATSIVISAYDVHHQMIPVGGLIMLALVGIVLLLVPPLYEIALGLHLPVPIVNRLIAGIALPLPFFVLWIASKGKMFGLGDVELMVPIGLSLGIVSGIVSVFAAFWTATVVVGIMALVKSRLLRSRNGGILKQAIPFGPFLLLAWYVMIVFGHRIVPVVTTFVGI